MDLEFQAGPDLPSPSGEGSSGTQIAQSDVKDMLAQMQAQIKLLCQKVIPGNEEKAKNEVATSAENRPLSEACSLPPHNQEGISLDYDDELLDLLNSPDDTANENDDLISLLESSSELEKQTVKIPTEEQTAFSNIVSSLDLGNKVGTAVLEKVANLVKNICSKKLAPQKLKEKMEKYQHPSNMELLQTSQVNKLIWDNIQLQARTKDLRLQKIQSGNVKAMIALTYLINDVLTGKAGQDKENVLLKLTDALAFLGSSNIDLNHFRRDLFKPELKAEYKNLCSNSVPMSTLLFGDDISQQVRDITDANKMSKCCLTPTRGRARGGGFRGKINYRGPYRGGNRRYQPFLGQRHRQYTNQLPRNPQKSMRN